MVDHPGDVTLWLRRLAAGDQEADSQLFEAIYTELRRRAGQYMKRERNGITLQPTALVNEALGAIMAGKTVEVHDRAHFMAIASRG